MNAKSWRAIPVAPLIAALTVLPLCGRCPAEPGAPSDASTSKFRVDLVQIRCPISVRYWRSAPAPSTARPTGRRQTYLSRQWGS